MFDFTGKVALVTGGAKGIGASIAKELLRNGVKGVALLDIDYANGTATARELGKEFSEDRVIYINTDVSQRDEFEDAFEQTIQTFGGLDIVVNAAGIVQELLWEKCVAVNLQGCITGSLLAVDKYFPKTLGPSQGIIINISSVMGLTSHEILPVYVATKHGVLGFSRSLSGPLRVRGQNIKILTICPGVTNTTIFEIKTNQMEEHFRTLTEKAIADWPQQTPEELAKNILLVTPNAKTGSVWLISGNVAEEIEFPDLVSLP